MEPASALGSGIAVNPVTWSLILVSVVATCLRILAKWNSLKPFHGDDYLALLALVLSVGSGVTVSLQVSYGLGRSKKVLTEDRLENFMKCSYAMSLLYLAALLTARLSIVLLLRITSPSTNHQRLCFIIGCFMTTWTVVCAFVSAFQCKTPMTWKFAQNKCIDRAGLWYSIGVLSVLTDLALICLPVFMVRGLNMKRSKKWIAAGSFGARIVNIGVLAIQLRYTSALNSADVSLDLWPWVLVAQFVQCVTIITSCIPYLHQLLECYPSGIFLTPLRYGSGGSAQHPVWDTTGANSQSTILQTTRISTRTDSTGGYITGLPGLSFE